MKIDGTLTQIYNVSLILEEFEKLVTTQKQLELGYSTSDQNYRMETHNFRNIIHHQIKEATDIIEELLPSAPRNKHGLINVLGSTIILITGNSDAEDVKEFHTKIEKLRKTQRKIIKSEKEAISLTIQAVNNFNNTIY